MLMTLYGQQQLYIMNNTCIERKISETLKIRNVFVNEVKTETFNIQEIRL